MKKLEANDGKLTIMHARLLIINDNDMVLLRKSSKW